MRLDRLRRHNRTVHDAAAFKLRVLDRYIDFLDQRMKRLDRAPTSSFVHSYAGEFDSLQNIDRDALQKLSTEFYTSASAENSWRNRYSNILANESTRVRLVDIEPGDCDYINANRVMGYGNHPGYIATQAPIPETMAHFWQMAFESGTKAIVMLTREQEEHAVVPKCDRYWPEKGQGLIFGDYAVYGVSEIIHENHGIIEREFHVSKLVKPSRIDSGFPNDHDTTGDSGIMNSMSERSLSETFFQTPVRRGGPGAIAQPMNRTADNAREVEDTRHITQIQYIDWPDQDVPHSPGGLLKICKRIDELTLPSANERESGPPIIHCSAGVGRTGTFIAAHKALTGLYCEFSTQPENFDSTKTDLVQDLVCELKQQRSKMVQTPEQYRFIYHAVAAGLQAFRAYLASEGTTAASTR